MRRALLALALLLSCAPASTAVGSPVRESASPGTATPPGSPLGGPASPSPVTPAPRPPPFVISRSFEGVGERQGSPPDLTLAAGPDRLLLGTNSDLALLSKEGSVIDQVGLTAFFADLLRAGERLTDPRTIFDRTSQRFFLTASATSEVAGCTARTCLNQFFIATSRSAAPARFGPSDWYRYAIDGTLEHGRPSASWGDFGMLTATADLLMLAVRMDAAVEPPRNLYAKAFVFDKAALLRGEPRPPIADYFDLRDPATGSVALQLAAVDALSDAPVMFLLGWGPGAGAGPCGLTVWGIQTAAAGGVTARSVGTGDSGCGRVPNARQSSGPQLDTNQGVLSAPPVYRNGFIWAAEGTQQPGRPAGVRLIQIDVRGWPELPGVVGRWELADPGVQYFYSAIGVTARGDVALVAARSGPDEFPSIYVSGRLSSDPATTLRSPALLKASETALMSGVSPNEVVRYGDYFGASTDPSDDSIWVVGEYAKSSARWGSWIGRIDLGGR